MPHSTPAHLDALKHPDAHSGRSPVKLTQTPTSFLLRVEDELYKVKKPANDFSNLAVKEAFCHEERRLLQNFNPDWPALVVSIRERADGSFALGGTEGTPVDYALQLPYLGEAGFLNKRLDKGPLDPKELEIIAERLADVHAAHPAKDKQAEMARPEKLRELTTDLMYQMKRYYPPAVTQPILDMVKHPVEKFLEEQTKLFAKRRKKSVVEGHGAFLPGHLHIKDKHVTFISPLEVHHKKYGNLDVANDVATLMVALHQHKQEPAAQAFLDSYLYASKDKSLLQILPLYLTFQALKQGIQLCELKVALQQEELGTRAMDFFHLAVRFARDIPRD